MIWTPFWLLVVIIFNGSGPETNSHYTGGTWWQPTWPDLAVQATTEPFDVQMEVPLVEQQIEGNYNRPSAAAGYPRGAIKCGSGKSMKIP